MEKIIKDFIVKELRALAVLMALMAVGLGYLVLYVPISPLCFLLIPLIIIAFVLRMYRQASGGFQRACWQYSENWRNQLGKEYRTEHPIYKTAYGEIHLMKTCIVCRNKRRLLFIPVEQVTDAEERFRSVGVKRIPLLKIKTDTDQTFWIEFSVRRCEDGAAVLAWLSGQIGAERVTQWGKQTPSESENGRTR